MSAGSGTYSIWANLFLFAIVYTPCLVGMAALIAWAQTKGVEIPSTGMNIGLFAGVVFAAGQRFATRRNQEWTSTDRHFLALGYTAASVVISSVLLGFLMAIVPEEGTVISALLQQAGMIVAVVLLLVALVYYGLARLMLRQVANKGRNNR